jgi:poly(3-hydroxybutyrate) depolymerase
MGAQMSHVGAHRYADAGAPRRSSDEPGRVIATARGMRRAVYLFLLVTVSVRADEVPPPPCEDCIIDVRPASPRPAPLLVVLHGDREEATARAEKWRAATARQGFTLLALDCPTSLGCDQIGRWYVWNGAPSWVLDQVRALAERVPIDMSRVYLAGWSGGATYIGKRMPAWTRMFAGIVIHGGGVPPRTEECPDRALPTYFLVGDRNPAHGGSKRLRTYLGECAQEVKWDLVPGANHKQEDAALTPEKADEILRWLAARGRVDAWS